MKKGGFIFHLAVVAVVYCAWHACTSKPSYYFNPLQVEGMKASSDPSFALPLQVNLLVLTKEPQTLSDTLKLALKSVASAWSWVLDLRFLTQYGLYNNLCCVNCDEKLDTFALYTDIPKATTSRQLDIIVIVTNSDCGAIPLSTVHYVSDASEIPSVVISTLRDSFELITSTEDEYVDGFLKAELCEINPQGCLVEVAKQATTSYIVHEASLLNRLIEHNQPTINQQDHELIESVRTALGDLPASLAELQTVAQTLTQLCASPSLAAEEYFQWDFKIGVYAPLMLPPLFPLVGALYWGYIARRKRKEKSE